MQRSFDDLGTPLHEVTFCVLDLETTGGTAADGGITEIGAVRVRGGEVLGTFRTFVNPGHSIPRQITVLTGITTAMVEAAPPPSAVLPTFLEFLGDAVIVGHNVRYDLGYLNAAMARTGRDPLPNRVVDTLRLAKRLVRDEVPNCRLGTLASRLRLPHRPSHRALDDALATADLLHALLERAAAFGVLGLEDLATLPTLFWGEGVAGWLFDTGMDVRFASLTACVALFFIPTLFAGMVSPYAVRIIIKDRASSGRDAGYLYFVSTLGSSAGTLLTSFFFVLWWEVNAILAGGIVFSLAVCLVCALLAGRARPPADAQQANAQQEAAP